MTSQCAQRQQADKHAGEAKAIADSAQSDLGMDYAWLDDVTYTDWQNYHDLVRREYLVESHHIFFSQIG
jgi:hypothetical protein